MGYDMTMMVLTYLLNLHPATVHFPIGLLVMASAAGIIYLHWRPIPQLITLTWWPMLIGWISCVVAVLTGLLAQSTLPPDAPYWRLLNSHVTTGLAILLLYGAPLYVRWIRRSKVPEQKNGDPLLNSISQRTRVWITLCFVVGGLLVLITGWSGGQLVYSWGVNVAK